MNEYFRIVSWHDGEEINLVSPLTRDQLLEIEKVANHQFMDDLTNNYDIRIQKVGISEVVESELNGAMMDGCYSKAEQIRYICDHGDIGKERREYLTKKYPGDYAKAIRYADLEHMQGEDNE